jgi:hypothetical protein
LEARASFERERESRGESRDSLRRGKWTGKMGKWDSLNLMRKMCGKWDSLNFEVCNSKRSHPTQMLLPELPSSSPVQGASPDKVGLRPVVYGRYPFPAPLQGARFNGLPLLDLDTLQPLVGCPPGVMFAPELRCGLELWPRFAESGRFGGCPRSPGCLRRKPKRRFGPIWVNLSLESWNPLDASQIRACSNHCSAAACLVAKPC